MMFFAKRGDGRRASRRRRASTIGRLSLEALDSRQLLAAGPLGINLATTLGFVDLMKEAPDFVAANSSTPLTLNAKGWPTSDASVLVLDERVNQPWNGPDPNAPQPDIGGTYHLSFHGQATVSPPGWLQIFTVQNQVYNATTNTTTADLVVQHNAYAYLQLYFTNTANPASSTGAGLTDVKLIQPGYDANTTQVFATSFLNDLAPFSTLRYLNADGANNYTAATDSSGKLVQTQWSQRTLPDAHSQTSPTNPTPGEAWEYMIALANASNTDMWINIPGTASDDYVTQLANLIKNGDSVNGVTYAGLNPNLKVYVEYSNELWGGIYNPYAVNTQATKDEIAAGGSALNNDGDTNQYDLAARRYLERTMQVTNIFRGVMGADPTYSRIRPVLGAQENMWTYFAQTFPWFDKTYGLPSNFFYGMGDATYMDVPDYSSADAILAGLAAQEPQAIASATDFNTVATYYGLKTVAYEGGPDLAGSGSAGQNALLASRDPRIEALVKQHYLNWYAAGGSLAMFYDGPYGSIAPPYEWSAADVALATNITASAKYRGLVDVAQAAPVAPTAGYAVSASGATTLTTASDTLSQSFERPNTGQLNEWLLNVATPGSYNLTLTTGPNVDPTYPAPGYQPAQIQVLTTDGSPLGTYTVSQNGTFNLGNIPLHAGLNTLAIKTLVGAYNPGEVAGYIHEIEPTGITVAPVASPTSISVGDPRFSTTGSWQQFPGYGHGGGIDDEAVAGDGTTKADWSFSGIAPGTYAVQLTWPSYTNRATNSPFTIYDGSTTLGSYAVNQQLAPTGATDSSGSTWQTLGTVNVGSDGLLKVELSNLANGRVEADAVRLVASSAAVSPPPPPPPPPANTPATVSVGDPGFSTSGTWQTFNFGHAGGQNVEAVPGNGPDKADWNFTGLVNTQYLVRITWPSYTNRATNAPFTIYDGSTSLGTYPVNQQLAPSGTTDASGTTWQQLAVVTDASGTLTVELTNQANGRVEADAVQIIAVPGSPTTNPPAVYLPMIVSVGDPGFSTSGTWQTFNFGHAGGQNVEAVPGNGPDKADWNFTGLAAGTYQVQATWPAYTNRATNAPFTIYDGSTGVGSYQVNQQVSPSGSTDSSGTNWQTLGTVSISSGTLKVELTNLANGRVEADAVKIVRVS